MILRQGGTFWENKQQKKELRQRGYLNSISKFIGLDQVIRNHHDGFVTFSHFHIDGYSMDGFNVHWITNWHRNPNTAAVY